MDACTHGKMRAKASQREGWDLGYGLWCLTLTSPSLTSGYFDVALALHTCGSARTTPCIRPNLTPPLSLSLSLSPGEFDVALALHACGSATDYAMLQAQRCGAAFVVSPCCIGKMVAANSRSSGRDDAAAKGSGSSDGENRGTNQEAAATCRSSAREAKAGGGGGGGDPAPTRSDQEAAVSGSKGGLLSLDLPQPRSQWMRSALAAGEGISGASTAYASLARAADISHRGGEAVASGGQGSNSLPENHSYPAAEAEGQGGSLPEGGLPGGVALLPGSHSYPALAPPGVSLLPGGVVLLPGGVALLPGSHSYPALALLAKSNVELDRLLAAEESSGWVKVCGGGWKYVGFSAWEQ